MIFTSTKSVMAAMAMSVVALTVPAAAPCHAESSVSPVDVAGQSADEATEVIYNATFTASDGGFTTDNDMVWKSMDSKYGWKAFGNFGGTNVALDAYLTSPEVDLTDYKDVTLSFDHIVSRASSPSDVLYVEVIADGKTTAIDKNKITWPEGTNWTSINSGKISLDEYVGKKIQIQFHYTSTSVEACIWAIQAMSIVGTNTTSGIHDVTVENKFDPSKPYEVYTVGGLKINDNASYRGVRIIRQGGKAWKAVK